ncbi:hypothetical protein [Nocardiopsis sp. NRRL B-16309]|uniref:hypothetical protein n=1 Tax=Nocardiopsis sp. NRRL B-16309 TaxID=1519494 RepID=UPI0006AEB34D|nr:hypothetical protein [Nocardiopsis sp. NRRL B-16309]KOX15504.1 hypothetical protein ADL05_15065 [Nocardiopsis sp. NRRL B-16309]
MYDLTDGDGRAVVVLGRAESGHVPMGERRDELVWHRLDTGAEESWRVPGQLIDAVALPDRTMVFTTAEGVFALR